MNFKLFTFVLGILLFTACNTDSASEHPNNSKKSAANSTKSTSSKGLSGNWKVVSWNKTDKGEQELSDCDQKTIWTFSDEDMEPLGDGTQVKKLLAKAPENCEDFGFEAKWTLKDGRLYVSKAKVGGFGGLSLSGLLELQEHTDKKLVVKHMKNIITLEKQ